MRHARIAVRIALALAVLCVAGCSGSGTGGGAASSASPVSAPVISSAAPSFTAPVPSTAAPSTAAPSLTPVSSRPASTAPVSTAPVSSTSRRVVATAAPSTATFPAGSGPLVMLDPGHNGGNAAHPEVINQQVPMGYGQTKECNTTGTATDAGYPEHSFNFDVASRAITILQAHGVRAFLSHPNDIGVGPCVNERAYAANRAKVDAAVSIHGDGAPAGDHGFFVNTAGRVPEGAAPSIMSQNSALAAALRNALADGSGMPTANYIGSNGIYPTTKFAALNLTTRPAAFLEIGNMRNSGDAALQSSPSGRQRIAAAVAAGILAYLSAR